MSTLYEIVWLGTGNVPAAIGAGNLQEWKDNLKMKVYPDGSLSPFIFPTSVPTIAINTIGVGYVQDNSTAAIELYISLSSAAPGQQQGTHVDATALKNT